MRDEEQRRILPVKTVYYNGKDAVKITRAGQPLRAMELALRHMRRNEYGATLAEVYHNENGKLYGVMKRTVDAQVHPVFQAPLKKGE